MRLDHVGVIIKHERQAQFLKDLLRLREMERGWVQEYQAECIMLQGDGFRIELILSKLGPLEKYNGGKGGVHHVALRLAPGEKLPEETPMIETEEVRGICGMMVNFIPPVAAGFPIEIVREARGDE